MKVSKVFVVYLCDTVFIGHAYNKFHDNDHKYFLSYTCKKNIPNDTDIMLIFIDKISQIYEIKNLIVYFIENFSSKKVIICLDSNERPAYLMSASVYLNNDEKLLHIKTLYKSNIEDTSDEMWKILKLN